MERTPNKTQYTKLTLEMENFRSQLPGLELTNFNYKSGVLATSYPGDNMSRFLQRAVSDCTLSRRFSDNNRNQITWLACKDCDHNLIDVRQNWWHYRLTFTMSYLILSTPKWVSFFFLTVDEKTTRQYVWRQIFEILGWKCRNFCLDYISWF